VPRQWRSLSPLKLGWGVCRAFKRAIGTSYMLCRFCVVRGTYMTSDLGGVGSCRETSTTGRVFAARPRSANHTSPGCGFIEQVENLLFGCARTH
jgi:hypothetical protein